MAFGEQLELRGDGTPPVINIEADCLAEATYRTILACHELGARVETPKQKRGMTLGYDGVIAVKVRDADSEPKIYSPGYLEDARGTMQYILEVTHGIHNHWKKDPNDPNDTTWGYTYNERFVNQLPFVFARIKADWDERVETEGTGRITGRDYHFATWIPAEDVILEQEDPPCLQTGNIRFLQDREGNIVMNYITTWRSRDLLKAWDENIVGQIELMRLMGEKVSCMLEVPIKLGSYIDISTSLHLYGLYIDRDQLEEKIENIKQDPYPAKAFSLEDYLSLSPDLDTIPWRGDPSDHKRLIVAQMDAEEKGHGKNLPRARLIELGYDIEHIEVLSYPAEWDTWPSSWDRELESVMLRR